MNLQILKILLFELDGKRFAFKIDDVVRVVNLVEITKLPGAPEKILGIINIEGEFIAVGDLKRKLMIEPSKFCLRNKIIVVRFENKKLAFVVDEIIGYTQIEPEEYVTGKEILPELSFLEGVAKINSEIVLINDIKLFLNGSENRNLDKALKEIK